MIRCVVESWAPHDPEVPKRGARAHPEAVQREQRAPHRESPQERRLPERPVHPPQRPAESKPFVEIAQNDHELVSGRFEQ